MITPSAPHTYPGHSSKDGVGPCDSLGWRGAETISRGGVEANTRPSVRVARVTVGSLGCAWGFRGKPPVPQNTAAKSGHTVAANPIRGCGCASLLKATRAGVASGPRETNAADLSSANRSSRSNPRDDKGWPCHHLANGVGRAALPYVLRARPPPHGIRSPRS